MNGISNKNGQTLGPIFDQKEAKSKEKKIHIGFAPNHEEFKIEISFNVAITQIGKKRFVPRAPQKK